MSRRDRVRGLGISAALVCIAVGARAHAEPHTDPKAAAEQLFEEGKRLVNARQYDEACPKLAESLRLDPGIGIRLHLASCWEKAGKPASAWAQFREAEQVATRERDTRVEVARRRAEALEPRLFRVAIVVPPESDLPGLEIVRDGVQVGRPQWGVAVPFDPGTHTVVVTAPGKQRWQTDVVVPQEPGSVEVRIPRLIDLPTETVVTAPAPKPVDPKRGRTQRYVGLAVTGLGVVGLAVGGYFGLQAKSKLDDSNANGRCIDNHCTPEGAELRNDARAAGNVSTVAVVAGAAAVGAGLVLYFTAPRGQAARGTNAAQAVRVTPYAGPGGGGLSFGGAF